MTVAVDHIEVDIRGPGRARAVFTQHHQAMALKEITRRTLDPVKVNGRWVIESELTAPMAAGNNG